MEHSMSGGVIKNYETKTIAKVIINSETVWCLCNQPCFEGDKVVLEKGNGVVQEIRYNVTAKNSPIPFSLMKEIIGFEE